MKKIYFIILCTCCLMLKLQAQERLTFTYDAAGNQTQRKWICANCSSSAYRPTEEQVKLLNDSKFADEDKEPKRSLEGFPNPVTEQMQVKWSSNEQIYVKQLMLFSVLGVKVLEKTFQSYEQSTILDFTSLAPGIYVLQAIYSDNLKETLKIFKK
ncbi:T9SS type A sorting domain-containing protein [Pedobacter glucosidilyticus]|uniref:T9SS type A sorting domain-containing protein n=1 Tax=Pedobacter glucosidilyticus TaxID=1122941 RepID=UPI0026F2524B|nr:T9SS type A sorting domain-containing protein [Pedobacter glucosidilyticus]